MRGEIVSEGPPGADAEVLFLDWISFVMDRMWHVPGTRLRFGLNSILLLLPVVGDVIPTLVSVGILLIGLRSRPVPRIVATRMVLNSLLDASLGWIPLVGDVFDLFFKADTRNVRLLQQYAGQAHEPPSSTWRHWVFVIGVGLGFLCVVGLIVWAGYLLVHMLLTAWRKP